MEVRKVRCWSLVLSVTMQTMETTFGFYRFEIGRDDDTFEFLEFQMFSDFP